MSEAQGTGSEIATAGAEMLHPKVVVVVPTYNEAENLPPLHPLFLEAPEAEEDRQGVENGDAVVTERPDQFEVRAVVYRQSVDIGVVAETLGMHHGLGRCGDQHEPDVAAGQLTGEVENGGSRIGVSSGGELASTAAATASRRTTFTRCCNFTSVSKNKNRI